MRTITFRWIFLLTLVVGSTACGTNKIYFISSDPPGAVVGSGRVVYGTTTFTTDLNTILPHRHWDGRPSASRLLTFTKDGYFQGTAVISEYGDAKDIHVVLQEQGGEKQGPLTEGSAESRLSEIQRLRDRNLISQEEYEAKRKQILDGI